MTLKEMRTYINALATAHAAARENSNNPHETARGFIRAVGAEEAAQCVAAMIRRASWDGRISREAKAWAQSVALSGEWERHIEDTYCDAIHPAHLSQIAEAMPGELDFCAVDQEQEQEAREWDGAALAAAVAEELPPIPCMAPTAMTAALHADMELSARRHAPGVTCRLNRTTWRVEYIDAAGNLVM